MITPEAIEAAARALLFRETMSDDGLSLDQMAQIALTAAAPFMGAATTKAAHEWLTDEEVPPVSNIPGLTRTGRTEAW